MFDAISRDDSFSYAAPYGPVGPVGPGGPRDQANPLYGADLMRSAEGGSAGSCVGCSLPRLRTMWLASRRACLAVAAWC